MSRAWIRFLTDLLLCRSRKRYTLMVSTAVARRPRLLADAKKLATVWAMYDDKSKTIEDILPNTPYLARDLVLLSQGK
jgi:hypothetical protein